MAEPGFVWIAIGLRRWASLKGRSTRIKQNYDFERYDAMDRIIGKGEVRRMNTHARLVRERHTMELMVRIYCQAHHQPRSGLCPDCRKFFDYACRKIERCPFHELKPVCADCRIHCYKDEMRDLVRTIMRYSGPRMLVCHPTLALLHMVDRIGNRKRGMLADHV